MVGTKKEDTVQSTVSTLLRLTLYLRPYRGRLFAAAVCASAVAGLTGLYAWLIRPFFDEVLVQRNHALLLPLAWSVLLVAILRAGVTFWHVSLLAYIEKWVVADLRDQLFVQLIKLPINFHDSHTSGRLVSRITYDTAVVGRLVPIVMRNLLQQTLTFLTMMGLVLFLNWRLTLWLVGIMPLSGYAVFRIGRRLRRLSKRDLELSGDLMSFLAESLSGIRLLKTYGREETEKERFHSINVRFTRLSVKLGQLSASASPLVELIGSVAIVGIMWYGGTLILDGAMTPGEVFSFMAALVMAYAPIRKMSSSSGALQEMVVAADRVFNMFDKETEASSDRGRVQLGGISNGLEFRSVAFCFDRSPGPVLKDITFSIDAGSTVALVGHSGSGKSTLVHLIPRLYDPNSGAILIDGHDVREFTLRSLREQIAVVPQETILFDDTVRNNIVYGCVEASDRQVEAALRAAYAWDFVRELPNGMDAVIGEKGIKLSGGQRQRLAIARAFLRDTPLLILDEATSSLDSESEAMVQRAMTNLMQNRTTVVIAHRLSTVFSADRIVVLHQGRMVGCGTHQDLLLGCDMYRRLCQTQFRDRLAAPFEK